ncbi:MAG: c-type cytochrome [Verrucomicrobia bacterium]|jgi:mono/diheme cytochrome c family protein|nr:c-type cytochrome [Verrucomicrobiota bacterium]
MNDSTASSFAASSGRDTEPPVGTAPVPMWLMVLPILLFFGGALYFDWTAAWFNPVVHAPFTSLKQIESLQPSTGGDRLLIRGKVVYEQVCALCHGVDGAGKPGQAPTFVGSEWVLTDNVGQLIRIPLQGLAGPITVKGQEWNLAMPAMGAALPDEDLAAVLTYMRNAWGNQAPPVTTEQVTATRNATKGRTQPWSAVELKAVQ